MKVDENLVRRDAISFPGPLVDDIKLGAVNVKFQDGQPVMTEATHHAGNGKHGHIDEFILWCEGMSGRMNMMGLGRVMMR